MSSLKRKKDLVKMAEAKKMVAAFTWKSLEGTDHAVRLNSKSGRYQSAVLRLLHYRLGLEAEENKTQVDVTNCDNCITLIKSDYG